MTATDEITVGISQVPLSVQKFPAVQYDRPGSFFGDYFETFAKAASSIDWVEIERAAHLLIGAYTSRARVFSCGNGGSAAIANHLHCDHLKGVRTETDLLPRVVSLSNSVELLTAIANDIDYEHVFSYQLQSQSQPGDVLIAISSSGRSPNIVRALSWARDNGLATIALTGFGGGDARQIADISLHFDCTNYGVVEDLHQAAMHALAQYIRQSRMTAAAIADTTF